MKTLAAAIAALSLASAALPAHAQTVKDKKSCSQAITDAKGAREDAAIGEKSMAKADDLIRIADHLCTQGNFVYAESLLQIARGMLANE